MPIHLTLERQTLLFDTNTIGIGRAPENQISLPSDMRLAAQHAVLKSVNGRWLIESREGGPVRIGNGRPVQFAWLNPGDIIHLTEAGPDLTFNPVPSSGTLENQTNTPAPLPVKPLPIPAAPRIESPPVQRLPVTTTMPAKSTGGKVESSASASASGMFIPADDWRIWVKPVGVCAVVSLLLLGAWSFRPLTSPQPSPVETATGPIANTLPSATAISSVAEPANVIADPRDFLVLIGIGDLQADKRPHVLGVGWLWDERTAVVARPLGDYLQNLTKELKNKGIFRQACVIQGVALEIADISSVTACPDISILKLKDHAELPAPMRELWQVVTARDIQKRRGQGKKFKYMSFRKLPQSPALKQAGAQLKSESDADRFELSLSWQAYDSEVEEFTQRAEEEARFVSEQGLHYLKSSDSENPLERVGLLITDDQKIVGMSVPNMPIVWTETLQRALQ